MADKSMVTSNTDVDITTNALSGNTAKASFLSMEGNTFSVNVPSVALTPKPNILVRFIDGISKTIDPVGYEKKRSEATLISLETEKKIYEQYKALYPSLDEKRLFLLAHGYNMTDAQAENVFDVINRTSEKVDKIPKKLPSAEFIDGFVEASKTAYDEDVRELFSRLLAGELDSPGSYSRRAMSILGSMSAKDAADFSKLCTRIAQISGEQVLMMSYDRGSSTYGNGLMTYRELSNLGSLGLVDMGGIYNMHLYDSLGTSIDVEGTRWVVFKSPAGKERISFKPVLTTAGIELSSLCKERDTDAIFHFFDDLVSKGKILCSFVDKDGFLVDEEPNNS